MKRQSVLWLLGILAVGGGIAFFLLSPTTGKEKESEEKPQTIVVKRRSLQPRVSETGTVEPKRTLEIKSQFSGEVLQLLVSEGESVTDGQPLAIIRQEPTRARQAAQLRALLEEEQLNVAQAWRHLNRMESLYNKGFIAHQDLESAQEDYQHAIVRRKLAERELLLALGGNEELYRRYVSRDASSGRLEEFRVLSPANGTIIKVPVQTGEIIVSGTATVAGGTVLMELADVSRMMVKAKINEVNITRVRIAQPVEIRLDAVPGTVFTGKVIAISPQGEKEEGENIVTYDVTIEIENEDANLRPMMTANVDILTDAFENVLMVPLESLQLERGDDVVYVLENGRRVRRKVRVAFRTDVEAVISQGIHEGEEVLLPTYEEEPSQG